MRVVRIVDIGTSEELSTDERISCVASAMEWLAVAQALIMIHGEERAAKRLDELGCPVRFNDDGEPCMVLA